jgi:hypothetical protein
MSGVVAADRSAYDANLNAYDVRSLLCLIFRLAMPPAVRAFAFRYQKLVPLAFAVSAPAGRVSE